LKRCIVMFLPMTFLFFLGVWAPAMAAKTDQTHLSGMVKTKQLLLIKTIRRYNENLPATMARISAYETFLSDHMTRAHQLRFLISVSESNPFEVRMYFKQATEMSDELTRESRAVRAMAHDLKLNLSLVPDAREDLRFIAKTAVSKKQKEEAQSLLGELQRFEATQLKIKEPLHAVLEQYDNTEKLLSEWDKALTAEIATVWSIYFTKPMFVMFDKETLELLPVSCFIWISSIGPNLESKTPDSPAEWWQSACSFLAFGFIFLLIFRWVLGRIGNHSDGNQDQWVRICRASSLSAFLWAGFWAASMINVFPKNIVFSRLAVTFGALAAISLAWGLREIKLRSGLPSPLYPLFYLFATAIIAQILNMPLRLLGALWPLGVGIMMFFMWRTARKYKDPAPRKLARFCFWSGFPIIALSLAGFTFPAVEVFLTLFLCSILYQFASAVSDLVRRRLARLQDKGSSLFHSVTVSLSIPIIWFFSVGVLFLWLSNQLGEAGILELAGNIQFIWQDLQIGLIQIVIAVALFFVIKPVVEVLKGGVERLGQKSRLDEAVMMPIETVISVGVWIAYGLIVLHIIGVKLSAVMVLAGGMSVGIGFGLQHIINNFVSGLILLFGRSVKPGDVIEHELVMGEVEKVTIRSTLIRTRDDTTMLIPNSNLVSMPFVNMSRGNRAVRLVVAVGAAYDSDTSLAERLLLEAAREHPDILKNPPPRVRFEDFKDNYLDFRIKFWVNFDGSKRVASDLRFAILKKFREHGVEIAFPQMDVHLKDVP